MNAPICQVIALNWAFYKLLDRSAPTCQVIALNWAFYKLLDPFAPTLQVVVWWVQFTQKKKAKPIYDVLFFHPTSPQYLKYRSDRKALGQLVCVAERLPLPYLFSAVFLAYVTSKKSYHLEISNKICLRQMGANSWDESDESN